MDLFIDMFMDMSTPTNVLRPPRLLRAVGDPLGSYYKVGRDYRPLQALIAEDRHAFSGLVFDAALRDRQHDLLKTAGGKVETVLDTRALELATDGGIANARVRSLPWAGTQLPHDRNMLVGPLGDAFVESVADVVLDDGYSAVLAPTHLVESADDPWLDVDVALTRRLRVALDVRGLRYVPIYYPLATRAPVFYSQAARTAIAVKLRGGPVDALWLRVHPFGTSSAGPLALRRYIEAARDLHGLGLPLVAEHVGAVGVALLAFGAVGGIESGITLGDRFNVGSLVKAPKPGAKGFTPAPRVYMASIGTLTSRAQADALFSKPALRRALACRDTTCCRRGHIDTALDPRRHFIIRRDGEVTAVSRRPEPVRASVYLEDFLRPATDIALRAVRVDPSLEKTRQRLEGWRTTLGALNQEGAAHTFAITPTGARLDASMRRNA